MKISHNKVMIEDIDIKVEEFKNIYIFNLWLDLPFINHFFVNETIDKDH